jgi:hypothetical protein
MEKLGANPANSCPLTPLGFLERAATVYGDCRSVVYCGATFTWSETFRRCLRLASALVSVGISRGDVVSTSISTKPPSIDRSELNGVADQSRNGDRLL